MQVAKEVFWPPLFFESTSGGRVHSGNRIYKESNGDFRPPMPLDVFCSSSLMALNAVTICAFEESIAWAKKEGFEKIFVVGGEKIYRASLPHCDEIFLTEVDANVDGDTFFPEVEWDDWIAIEKKEWALEKHHELWYRFCHFKRKN